MAGLGACEALLTARLPHGVCLCAVLDILEVGVGTLIVGKVAVRHHPATILVRLLVHAGKGGGRGE